MVTAYRAGTTPFISHPPGSFLAAERHKAIYTLSTYDNLHAEHCTEGKQKDPARADESLHTQQVRARREVQFPPHLFLCLPCLVPNKVKGDSIPCSQLSTYHLQETHAPPSTWCLTA